MTKKVLKRGLVIILSMCVMLFLLTLSFLIIKYHSTRLNIDQLTASNTGIKVYASNYLEDDSLSYKVDRKIINITELEPYTINAFVDIEDKRFFRHNGYDPKRIIKSALVNLKSNNKTQGASTITQQLVKNTLLSNEKTYKRKLNEIMLAIKVEKNFSKDEILNMYLNTIYFGSNAYGIENASQIYFNKSASELDINESAILAGLIKSPKTYSPRYNKEKCFERKNLVLKQMYELNHLTKEEYEENIMMPVEPADNTNNYENTYFQQAILEACQILNISERELARNNYQILTFMDENLQEELEETLNSNNLDCDKLSIVSTRDGKILAYFGVSDYDLTNMKRTPASALKPVSVYLPSIVHNICHIDTPILDEKIDFDGYSPRNSNDEYSGWITIKEALSQSKNIPAVKLLNCLGIENSIKFLTSLGLNLSSSDESLSLALGALTDGINIKKLLEVYTLFQDYGKLTKLRFVDKILDKDGFVVYESEKNTLTICDEGSAYLTVDMLKESAKNGTAKNLNSLNIDIASKTGTNYHNGKTYDLYNIAFTKNYSAITWLGSGKGEEINGLTSSFHATNISKQIFEYLIKNFDVGKFDLPPNVIEKNIDLLELNLNHKLSLSSENTPERYIKKSLFKRDNLPSISTSLYDAPDLDFSLNLTTSGAKFNFNSREIFSYDLIKLVDGKESVINTLKNLSAPYEFIDDKIFSHEKISYKLKAKNKYTNLEYLSDEKTIYPLDFLMSLLKNSNLDYNTKKRWYV